MRRESMSSIRLSNHSIRLMVEVMKDAGVDHTAVVRTSGLPQEVVDNAQGEVTGQQELAFQRSFVEATRHVPGIGLRTGLRYRIMSYGPLGFAVLAAPTVAKGLLVLDSFQDLTFSLMNYHPTFEGDRLVSIVADESLIPLELRAFSLERCLGSMYRFLADMRQQKPRLTQIECSLDRPHAWQEYEDLIPFPVRFGCGVTRWVFEDGAGHDALPMASPLSEQTYEQMCETIIEKARSSDDFVARLVNLLVRSQRGVPTAIEAAEVLAISERTLHRRLAQQDLTFGQIVDDVRYQRARLLLDGLRLPVAHIAEMLGFSEVSGFSRAFKRWSGMSPFAFRRRGSI